LKEIELKTRKIQQNNQQCVIITGSRRLLSKCHSFQTNRFAESTENWCVNGLINFEEPFSGLDELSFNPVSYNVKTDYEQKCESRYTNSAVTLIEQSVK